MRHVPDKWWSSGVDPSKLAEHVVKADKWDRRDFARMEAEAAELASAGQALSEFAETGAPLMADTFHSLHKAAPHLADPTSIRPSYLINRAVMEEAQELSEHKSLRSYTRGDDVAAALAAASLEPDLETLLDREQILQQEAQKLEQTMAALASANAEQIDLDEMMARWTEEPPEPGEPGEEEGEPGEGEGVGGDGPGNGGTPSQAEIDAATAQGAALQQQIEALGKEAEAQGAAVSAHLQRDTPSIRAHLAQSFERAVENTRQISAMTRAWGLEQGVMSRLPASERIEFAKRLNTPRMRRIAELFGPMRNLAMAEQMRKTDQAVDEVVGITLGRDLERILPSELMKLGGPREDEFYRDFAEGRLPIWELEGRDKIAKGAIILCEDGSLSMGGEPEYWAKAVMGSLLNIARKQKRAFHLVHFGGPGQTHTISFEKPADYTVDRILEAFEIFFGGGPLRVDQRVATPDGWRAIGSLVVGDRVFGPDGEPAAVTGVYPQGELDLFRVTFSDGAEVVCDDSHLWTVDSLSNRGRWHTKTLRELMARGLRYTHKAGSQYKYSVPISKPLNLPKRDLPVSPYLLGYMLGNGGFSGTSPAITSVTGDEVEWMKEVPVGIEAIDRESRPGACPSYQLVAGRRGTRSNPLTDELAALGLWGLTGPDKYIPDLYLWADVDQRFALLQGLCDSDGCISNNGRVAYDTTSLKLAEDVAQLMRSLGGLASVHGGTPQRSNEQPIYKVALRIPPSLPAPFRLDRYVKAWKPRKRFIRSMETVVPVGRGEAICIKVDREDGLFLTEGMVVTHNTDFATPLQIAVDKLRREYDATGHVDSDVVFLSDGLCGVSDQFQSWFREEQDRLGFTLWGIIIGMPKTSEPLYSLADGKVCEVKDLVANGSEVRSIFGGV